MLLLPRPSVHGGAVRAWEGFLEVEKWKGFDKSEGKWHLYGAEVLGFQLVHLFISSSIPAWVMSPPGPRQLLEVFMVSGGGGEPVPLWVM